MLQHASIPLVRNKLQQLLQFGARGVQSNPSATAPELAGFTHSLLTDCLGREEAARARAKEATAGAQSVQAMTGKLGMQALIDCLARKDMLNLFRISAFRLTAVIQAACEKGHRWCGPGPRRRLPEHSPRRRWQAN